MVQNNMMYFWRVIFTYVIALHHLLASYSIKVGWYIGVDFFAILAGYLLCQHIEKHPEENVLTYAKSRFMHFIPIVFASALVRWGVDSFYKPISFWENVGQIFSSIPEYLLLNAYSICPYLNSIDWFIQVLVIPSILLMYFVKKNKSFMGQIFAPLVAWLIFSVLFHQFKHAQGYIDHSIDGFTNWPLLRVFAGLCLGVFCYTVSQEYHINAKFKGFLLSTLGFSAVVLLSYFYGETRADFLYILMMGFCMILGFASTANKIFNNKFIQQLSKLSLFIYLNHYTFRIIIRRWFDTLNVGVILLYLISITVFSWLMFVLFEQGKRYLKMKRIMK